jgi:hypothetical protein
MKTSKEEVKLVIKEMHQKVIEYGINQEEKKNEQLKEKEKKVKKEKGREETHKINLEYKYKKPPSDSSSSSSSSEEGNGNEERIRRKMKERMLVMHNLKDNDLDIEFIKESLLKSENGSQLVRTLEGKGYKFTKVHKIYGAPGEQDVYERMKGYGCVPVTEGMQCPYCKWNRYNGNRTIISGKLNKHMQMTHLINNNNHALNMLFNLYGKDWWMDIEHKYGTMDVDFRRDEIGYCTAAIWGVVEINLTSLRSHKKYCMLRAEAGEYEPFWELLKENLIWNQKVSLWKYRIRKVLLRWGNKEGVVTFSNNRIQIEGYDEMNEEYTMGTLRVRSERDEWLKDEFKREIVTLSDEQIKENEMQRIGEKPIKEEKEMKEKKAYDQNKKIRDNRNKATEETEEIEEVGKEKRSEKEKEKRKGTIIDRRTINSDDEDDKESEEQPSLIDIIRKDEDKGFTMGNKPRTMKTRYQNRKERKEVTKEELRGNATSIFLSHNMNKGKWWNDPQVKKEDWVDRNLTKSILSKSHEMFKTIQETREGNPAGAMKMIQRILMQMHARSRNTNTKEEGSIIDYKGWLCLEALKIEAPIGNMKTIKMIVKSIESTYIKSIEYLILKAEILVRTREWREAAMAINGTGASTEVMTEDWMKRIAAVNEKIKENDNIGRRNKLISYSNEVSKNLFQEDEEINKATVLMWNREYEEATDTACKIWTKIMANDKPEMIFPKVKVLQIMIESTLSITMSNLQYAEEWLETLKKLDFNGILTRILDIKMMMRHEAEESEIAEKYNDTIKGIEIIDDALQRKDWYEQM